MPKGGWVQQSLYDYIFTVGNRISDTKLELRKATKKKWGKWAGMLTAVEQAELMKMMVKLSWAKKGIEVGTFTGYSALWLAEGLPEDGQLICLDISEEWTSVGLKYWKQAGVDTKIDLRIAPGVQTLDSLIEDESNLDTFDFAFIDADKENYIEYYERLLKLLKPNGFIMIDNVFWGGSVIEDPKYFDEDTKILRAISELVREDERVTHWMIPIGDGLSIVRKN